MSDHSDELPILRRSLDRRQFLAGMVGGAGALALAGCKGSDKTPAGQRTVRKPDGALGFPTPFAAIADFGYNQMSLIFDTLLWRDGSGQLLPWLAEAHRESEDHLTHTFVLRDDLKWSDGRPLTADDVVFTFEYLDRLGSLSPPVIIQPPQGIANFSATDARTVVLTLENPRVTFVSEVAGAVAVVPRHVWQGITDPLSALDKDKHLVGTGPYRLVNYDGDGGSMLYTARDDYFLGAPYVKRIEFRALTDQVASMLSGTTDMGRGFGFRDDTLAPFRRDPAYGMISEVGSFVTAALYWNLDRGGALADVRFRQACAMAIDRNDLLTRLSAGKGAPGNPGFLSPQNPWYVPVRQYEFDVAGANALLDSAGYRPGPGGAPRRGPDGQPLSFEFRFEATDHAPLSELMIPALKRIGVELRPKPATIGPDLFGPKFGGGYEMTTLLFPGPSPGGLNADPDLLRRTFSSKMTAFSLTGATGYRNPRFDELADQQLVTFEEAERRRMVAEMQRILADDLAILPLWYPEKFLMYRKQALDTWYFTPGQFPTSEDNKHAYITGMKTGTTIRQR